MWKDIEEINWKERCKDPRGYEQAKRYIMDNFTPARCKKLRKFVDKQFDKLYKRIEEFEQANDCRCGQYGGDDSFMDMIHHAIGLGEKYFMKCMALPTKLNTLNFVESFSYCIPDEDDFEAIENGYFEEQAVRCIWELARILKENEPSLTDTKVIVDLLNRFGQMAIGNFKKACGDVTTKNYDTFYQFESNDMHALFANILSDCKKFKL